MSTEVDSKGVNFKEQFEKARLQTAESVLDFKFNKTRVRILSANGNVPDSAKGIVYWMSRDARVQDNWAFLFVSQIDIFRNTENH